VKLGKKTSSLACTAIVAIAALSALEVSAATENLQRTAITKAAFSEENNEQGSGFLALGDAVAMALDGNPGLAVIEARARALRAIPEQKGALPDPQLFVNFLNFRRIVFHSARKA